MPPKLQCIPHYATQLANISLTCSGTLKEKLTICLKKCFYNFYTLKFNTKRNITFKKIIVNKMEPKYNCEKCNYACNYLSVWTEHLICKKHTVNLLFVKKNFKFFHTFLFYCFCLV